MKLRSKMNIPISPGVNLSLDSLPKQPQDRHEVLVDLFGRYVMWMRNWNNQSTKRLIESAEAREKLGTILRQPFEEAALRDTSDGGRAVRVAEASVDAFIRLLLQVFAHSGSDFLVGKDHALRFRLVMELVEMESDELVHEEVINRGGQKHFADYWGRWLNRFKDEKPPETR
jgi:hypothetical protein